eukprot:354603-Chlamydomonas_euryale.AAC.6
MLLEQNQHFSMRMAATSVAYPATLGYFDAASAAAYVRNAEAAAVAATASTRNCCRSGVGAAARLEVLAPTVLRATSSRGGGGGGGGCRSGGGGRGGGGGGGQSHFTGPLTRCCVEHRASVYAYNARNSQLLRVAPRVVPRGERARCQQMLPRAPTRWKGANEGRGEGAGSLRRERGHEPGRVTGAAAAEARIQAADCAQQQ